MTNVENIRENINSVGFGDLNIGDTFESCGKIYIKYYDDELDCSCGLQIYPPDNSQFHCEGFSDDELVFERQCTITIA